MTEVRNLLLFCFFVSIGAQKPTIQLIPSEDNFVEDKPTTYTCHMLAKGVVTWMIRDRTINAFLSSNYTRLQQTKPQKLTPGEKSIFTVVMRRDFSNLFVVCRTANHQEAGLHIPSVRKTNSIREVRFGFRHQVRGRPLAVHCDVDDPERVVKRMFFRVPYYFERAKERRTLKDNWFRFSLKRGSTKKANVLDYNWWPIQCFAVTKHEMQDFGNVMSPTTTFVVHYLEFSRATFENSETEIQNSTTEIALGQRISVSLEVTAHPRPSETEFVVTHADGRTGVDRRWTEVEKIDDLDVHRFQVLLRFAPKESGTFKVLFESKEKWYEAKPMFTNSSDNFTVNVFHPHFDNLTSHWHKKSLTPRKLLTDHFLLYTRPKPRSDQLQMLLLSGEDPKVSSEMAEEGFTKIVKMDGQKNLYRVELTVVDPKTGTYAPVFRSGSLNVFGPKLRITVLPKVDRIYPMLIAILLLCLCLLGIVIIWDYRCRKKEIHQKSDT